MKTSLTMKIQSDATKLSLEIPIDAKDLSSILHALKLVEDNNMMHDKYGYLFGPKQL